MERHAECPDSSAADRRDVSRRSGIDNEGRVTPVLHVQLYRP
jgi:hypothetical protein